MSGGFMNQGPEMIHQEQATLNPQQFDTAYSLPTPSGSQLNEIRAVNGVFHLRWTKCLPNGAAHLRQQGPPQLVNQPQLSQVQLWNAQGPAELSGPLQHHMEMEADFNPSTQVLESSMVERTPVTPPLDYRQINQAQVMPSMIHPHQSNQDSRAIESWPQEAWGQRQQPTHVQIVSNVVANSKVPMPSMLPRFPPVQLEELTAGVHTTPTDGISQRGMLDKRACKRHASSSQGHEPGESSRVSSKRQRISSNSNDQEALIPPNPRKIINGCYNPIYNEMGLPLDPHLRLLEASLKNEFPHES